MTFVNSASGRQPSLESYADLLDFTRRHVKVRSTVVDALEDFAETHPEDAAAAFEEAGEVLEVLSRIFNALADRQQPPRDAVQALNSYFTGPLPARCLSRSGECFRWVWATPAATDLRRPLWYVLWSAGEILTSPRDCRRITRCAAEDCGALFVARNPGKPRKWCDKPCGSRATSRAHYQKNIRPLREKFRRAREAAKWTS